MTAVVREPAASLVESVALAVEARGDEIKAEDQAAVDLAMRYALQIEQGIAAGGQAATKALYLGPHLLKTLSELGCTPAGRVTLLGAAGGNSGAGSKLSRLRASRGA